MIGSLKRNLAAELCAAIRDYKSSAASLEEYDQMFQRMVEKEPNIMNIPAPLFGYVNAVHTVIVNGDAQLYQLVRKYGGKLGRCIDGRLHDPYKMTGVEPLTLALSSNKYDTAYEIAYEQAVCRVAA